MQELLSFLTLVEDDGRVGPLHISLYLSLWKKWKDSGHPAPLFFFRRDLLPVCKITGNNSFHRVLKDLHDFGYIRYLPSYDRYRGSCVYLNKAIST